MRGPTCASVGFAGSSPLAFRIVRTIPRICRAKLRDSPDYRESEQPWTKKRGGACSGHRLDRKPPGDTLLVSAPLYGRCLLLEANLCANCRWTPDGERIDSTVRRSDDIVKRFLFRTPPQNRQMPGVSFDERSASARPATRTAALRRTAHREEALSRPAARRA